MPGWRDTILKDFERGISRLTLVSDPDGLLTEEGMLSEIRDRGFYLIPFEDPVAFRYAYESNYRSKWDKREKTDLVVVLRSEQDIENLPYDLLRAGRQLKYALHKLFSKLNYPVIAALDRSYLDVLYEAYQHHDDSILGERATKEFVLAHCFKIVPQLISTPVDLMRVLLSRHYRNMVFPEILDDFILETLGRKAEFAGWPLNEIWPSRKSFLRFLQMEWEKLLESMRGSIVKSVVPFEHQDVRAYTDTYFWEGLLTPLKVDDVEKLPQWVRVGVTHDPKADAVNRMRQLLKLCQEELPSEDSSHRDWQKTAQQWAELTVLRWEMSDALETTDAEVWSNLQSTIESKFEKWMLSRYSSLHNLPFLPRPVMVHHVPRYLAARRARLGLEKLALVVIDGLALDQWVLLRRSIGAQDPRMRFHDSSVFAWVPTLTAVSRQSIFAGDPPLYFPESFSSTIKEEARWIRFWEDEGVTRTGIGYIKKVESGNSQNLTECLQNPDLAILGVVVNTVDEIMHGEKQGTAGMHDAIRLWLDKAHSILLRLLDSGYTVFLTADHGNVAAEGMGQPQEGVFVETAGNRARIYDNKIFLEKTMSEYPDSFAWPNIGLPPDNHVLLPTQLKAFAREGKKVVSHGGVALEEVIVPFIEVSRDDS